MRRPAWLLLACVLSALACKPSAPPDVVSRVTIDAPEGHWAREGFVPMVPPVRLPSSSATLDDVTVWLAIPEGGVITTRVEDDGRVLLDFPPGTRSDRVESYGKPDARVVVDVRGTRIDEQGKQWMHTLRRAAKGSDTRLFGYAWPREDSEAHTRATRELLAELAQRPPGKHMKEQRRARYLASIERKNNCIKCHTYGRPTNAREGQHGLVNRGTDASGFFTPQTVLLDEIVLERYGKLDPNLDNDAVSLACPDGKTLTLVERNDRLRAECPDRAVPVGRVDLHALNPDRSAAVCRARRYLYEHLDAEGRQIFASAIQACESVTMNEG